VETGLRGRRALVTAASRGLGFASARALAADARDMLGRRIAEAD